MQDKTFNFHFSENQSKVVPNVQTFQLSSSNWTKLNILCTDVHQGYHTWGKPMTTCPHTKKGKSQLYSTLLSESMYSIQTVLWRDPVHQAFQTWTQPRGTHLLLCWCVFWIWDTTWSAKQDGTFLSAQHPQKAPEYVPLLLWQPCHYLNPELCSLFP